MNVSAAEFDLKLSDPVAPCPRGDELLRNGEIARAEQYFLQAAAADATTARAYLGLSRVARMRFQRRSARLHLEKAFRLDSLDPDILFAYSEYVWNPEVRAALTKALREFPDAHDLRIAHAIAKTQIARALSSRPLNLLDGAYRHYRLPLAPFFPQDATSRGTVLKVSLNGEKPLRLLLDSGASGLVLSERSVRGAGLEVLARAGIGGFGSSDVRTSSVALARSVAVSDFRLDNCLVQVTKDSPAPGADGIIGTDVFQEFRIRLDVSAQMLELQPFADHTPVVGNSPDPWLDFDAGPELNRSGSTQAVRVGHLLTLPAVMDDGARGWFALDTGAAHSIIDLAWSSGILPLASPAAWRGAQGTLQPVYEERRVDFRVSGATANLAGPAVVIDLSEMNRQTGFRIACLLGYSALRGMRIQLDYRYGLLQIAPRSEVEPER